DILAAESETERLYKAINCQTRILDNLNTEHSALITQHPELKQALEQLQESHEKSSQQAAKAQLRNSRIQKATVVTEATELEKDRETVAEQARVAAREFARHLTIVNTMIDHLQPKEPILIPENNEQPVKKKKGYKPTATEAAITTAKQTAGTYKQQALNAIQQAEQYHINNEKIVLTESSNEVHKQIRQHLQNTLTLTALIDFCLPISKKKKIDQKTLYTSELQQLQLFHTIYSNLDTINDLEQFKQLFFTQYDAIRNNSDQQVILESKAKLDFFEKASQKTNKYINKVVRLISGSISKTQTDKLGKLTGYCLALAKEQADETTKKSNDFITQIHQQILAAAESNSIATTAEDKALEDQIINDMCQVPIVKPVIKTVRDAKPVASPAVDIREISAIIMDYLEYLDIVQKGLHDVTPANSEFHQQIATLNSALHNIEKIRPHMFVLPYSAIEQEKIFTRLLTKSTGLATSVENIQKIETTITNIEKHLLAIHQDKSQTITPATQELIANLSNTLCNVKSNLKIAKETLTPICHHAQTLAKPPILEPIVATPAQVNIEHQVVTGGQHKMIANINSSSNVTPSTDIKTGLRDVNGAEIVYQHNTICVSETKKVISDYYEYKAPISNITNQTTRNHLVLRMVLGYIFSHQFSIEDPLVLAFSNEQTLILSIIIANALHIPAEMIKAVKIDRSHADPYLLQDSQYVENIYADTEQQDTSKNIFLNEEVIPALRNYQIEQKAKNMFNEEETTSYTAYTHREVQSALTSKKGPAVVGAFFKAAPPIPKVLSTNIENQAPSVRLR
ncbi:MAG: hypothetical protein ACK4PR_05830, partial [Gammaproteobacteria bacterium]